MKHAMRCGPFALELHCSDELSFIDLESPFLQPYRNFTSPCLDTIKVDLELPKTSLSEAGPGSLVLPSNWRVWKRDCGGHVVQFWTEDCQDYSLEAVISEDLKSVSITCLRRHPGVHHLEFYLSSVTRWLGAHLAIRYGGFQLHCASIARKASEQGAILAIGPSGAGKSTFAGFFSQSPDYQVLTDETCMVIKTPQGFMAYGTPWHGMLAEGINDGGPVRGAFFLVKAPANAFQGMSPAEATLKLVPEIFLPPWNAELTARALDAATSFVSEISCKYFSFQKSDSVVEFLRETQTL